MRISFALLVLLLASSNAVGAPQRVQPLPELYRPANSKRNVPPVISWQDSLIVLGSIYPAVYGSAVFGDTDHDGLREIMMTVDFVDSTTLRTLEAQGGGVYADVSSFQTFFVPYAIGDLDQDGNFEVVGQTSYSIDVLESQSATTHPTTPSWSSPPLSNILGYSNIGDTDRDGRIEIIHSINPSRFVVYECTGDNEFTQKFFHQGPFQDNGRKVIADFDGDGVDEIAVSGSSGYLQVFESQADDAWVRTHLDSTGLVGAYGIGGGLDTDGNGLPELFVVGSDWPENSDPIRRILIYEAPSNDTFVVVATLTYDDQHIGGLVDAVAVDNFDGVGLPEAVFKFFRVLLFCRAVSPGQWMLSVGAIDPDPNGRHSHLQVHDMNLNGRPELFWLATTNTFFSSLVLEHPGPSPTDNELEVFDIARLNVTPNPARSRAAIFLGSTLASARSVVVFDAAGRLVQRHILPHEATRMFLWSTLPPRPGIYFLRAENAAGRPIATGRATVIR